MEVELKLLTSLVAQTVKNLPAMGDLGKLSKTKVQISVSVNKLGHC